MKGYYSGEIEWVEVSYPVTDNESNKRTPTGTTWNGIKLSR